MQRLKSALACGLVLALSSLFISCSTGDEPGKPSKPNIIFIFADDLGYADLGCYGSTKNRTPHLNRMAEEGTRFTDFYVTSGVCTPSRASLMTGCYPRRVDLHENTQERWVLFPRGHKGLNPSETTIAEMLKEQGYATACIGKWHLGDQEPFLPTRHGFDTYYGIPYSNDMGSKRIPLPLLKDESVMEAPVDQTTLTQNYTRQAIRFIEENRDQPFFIYLPHTMPHVPLYSSEAFRGESANGEYGDAIEELDWSTGQILEKLKELGIDEQTMVIFSSDNGASTSPMRSNGLLRGGKGSTDEGGMRVPFVLRWPGQVPAGRVCSELVSTIDMLPTFAHLAGGQLPENRKIDGKNIWPIMAGEPGAESPHEAFFYYHTTQLQAVRSGKWKMILPQKVKKIGWDSKEENTPLKLIDLSQDIHEDHDVSAEHPEVVARLMALADEARNDLGDMGTRGSGQREAGRVDEPEPLLMEGVETLDLLEAANLDAFRPVSEWRFVGEAAAGTDQKTLDLTGEGAILANGTSKNKQIPYLLTKEEFGDVRVELEFMIPKGSNAGVYLMGRYEVQILDSYGRERVGSGDLGGIYSRYDPERPKGKQSFEGSKPKVNAARPPGEWQTMEIIFRAPHFDGDGKKVESATFEDVRVNGQRVQREVVIGGPTRSSPLQGEAPLGPIAIQGDHGPIAIKSFRVSRLSKNPTENSEALP